MVVLYLFEIWWRDEGFFCTECGETHERTLRVESMRATFTREDVNPNTIGFTVVAVSNCGHETRISITGLKRFWKRMEEYILITP